MGENPTIIAGMTLLRIHSSLVAGSGVLRPSICIVARGAKVANVGDTVIRYQAGDFLVSSVHMPLVGRPVDASPTDPYLAIVFELQPRDVLEAMTEARVELAPGDSTALLVGTCDDRLLDVVLRTLNTLDDEREARVLGPLLRRELAFRLVTGDRAADVCRTAQLARSDVGIGRAIEWIRVHFRQRLAIRSLARVAHMSTSSLHKKFKATLMMGPLQYQKRLRLEEARRLLFDGLDVSHAAREVGYESASQFTREYRRQFGQPPLRHLAQLRKTESG